MIKYFIYFISILLSTTHLFANGGPVNWSTVLKTGRVQLLNKNFVDLHKEDLSITIEGDYSDVKAKYFLVNKNSNPDTITYGFPVDVIEDLWDGGFILNNEDLPEIKFMLDGKPLSIKKHIDLAINTIDVKTSHPFSVKRHWYIVDLIIPSKGGFNLEVNYKVKNHFVDYAYSKSFFTTYDKRHFIYDFRPASYWGSGTIKELNVSVDLSKILYAKDSIKMFGMDLVRNTDGIYTAKMQNLSLAQSDPLVIQYENKISNLSKDILKGDKTKKYIKAITTTSTLKGNYQTTNLADRDFSSAWVEGNENSGVGEKITLHLNAAVVGALCIINGYTKSEETYYNNNRIKKAALEFEYVIEEDTDVDEHESYFKEFKEVDFPDLAYMTIDKSNFAQLITIVADFGDIRIKLKKITLTILEIYPGKKYNDTCISEIYLLGYDERE